MRDDHDQVRYAAEDLRDAICANAYSLAAWAEHGFEFPSSIKEISEAAEAEVKRACWLRLLPLATVIRRETGLRTSTPDQVERNGMTLELHLRNVRNELIRERPETLAVNQRYNRQRNRQESRYTYTADRLELDRTRISDALWSILTEDLKLTRADLMNNLGIPAGY